MLTAGTMKRGRRDTGSRLLLFKGGDGEGRNDVISGDAGGCGCEGGNGILSGRGLQGHS